MYVGTVIGTDFVESPDAAALNTPGTHRFMFISTTRLPQLLAPRDYYCAEQYERERKHVLRPAWHAVATTCELKRSGDFVARELFGHPIQIRNFDGELRVLSNVCAHRHCLLTNKSRGNSTRMNCRLNPTTTN